MVSSRISKIKKDLSKDILKNKKQAKKVTLVVRDESGAVTEKQEKVKKEKKFDPIKANAIQVLQRIAFTYVDDRMLMNSEDIEKHETSKKFLGFDNPTTCQLNLNFLYCKAISALERRLASVEKQLKAFLNPAGVEASENNISGKKRKRESTKEDIESSVGSTDVNVGDAVTDTKTTFQAEDESGKAVEIIDLDAEETKTG